jgi:hypothetical protein
MGQGGPKEGETHEITIELEGAVDTSTFKKYLEALRGCLDDLAKLTAKDGKPRVRIIRTRIRKK